jgi:hypothetical protein
LVTPKRYPAGSTYFVRVNVKGHAVDPDHDVVEMALLQEATPPDDDGWQPASWKEEAGALYARLLVGAPSDLELERARWNVWLRVTTDGRQVVRRVGAIDVT